MRWCDRYCVDGDWFVERAKYIPLRLSMAERKKLRLVEACMEVSEYTDKVRRTD